MTERLKFICSLIDRCESFIDVGCDHGYVTEFVYKNKLAEKITACDISLQSLNKAKKRLCGSGVNFICADGATAANGYGTVLACGMGGMEIVHIIGGCAPDTFILSPQSDAPTVRKTLLERDYAIVADRVIRDGKKYYDVIKATAGGGTAQLKAAHPLMIKFGMKLNEYNHELTDKLEKLLAAASGYKQTEENILKANDLKEAILWQQRLKTL